MIAPRRETETDAGMMVRRRQMRRVRRAVGLALLPPSQTGATPRAVPVWQAWLLAGWVVLVAGYYVARVVLSL